MRHAAIAAVLATLSACQGAPQSSEAVLKDADDATPPTSWIVRLQELAVTHNVFSRGDVEYSCSDFEGRLSARGNVWLSRFRVGPKVQGEWAVSSGGNFVLRDGSTDGRVAAAGSAWLANYSVTSATTGGTASCFQGSGPCQQAYTQPQVQQIRSDLDKAGAAFVEVADEVKQRASVAGKVVTLTDGELRFEATAPGANLWYFRVSASDLAAAAKVVIKAPAEAIVAIDVAGSDAKIVGLSDSYILDGIRKANVLLNLADATKLAIGDAVLFANVLAPRAATRFFEGRIEGGLYVGSLWGNPMQTDYTAPLNSCTKSGGQVNFVPFYSI